MLGWIGRNKMNIPNARVKSIKPDRKSNTVKVIVEPKPIWNLWDHGVTQSSLTRFITCPEKHRLAMVEGLTSRGSAGFAVEFGNVFHEALDILYTALRDGGISSKPSDIRIQTVLSAMQLEKKEALRKELALTAQTEERLYEEYSLAAVVLREYCSFWEEDWDNSKTQWVGLEQEFEILYPIPIENEDGSLKTIYLRGKIDGILRIGDKLWLLDTKTKGNIEDESIKDKLTFDMQVMFYMYCAWKYYRERPIGLIYNLVKRPQLRKGAKESSRDFVGRVRQDVQARPEHYFMRYEAYISAEDLKEWQNDLRDILVKLVEHYEGKFNWKNSAACTQYFKPCEFLPICSRGERGNFKRKDRPFTELEVR
jgi:ATP-dependent helicase/DNAse subunit B